MYIIPLGQAKQTYNSRSRFTQSSKLQKANVIKMNGLMIAVLSQKKAGNCFCLRPCRYSMSHELHCGSDQHVAEDAEWVVGWHFAIDTWQVLSRCHGQSWKWVRVVVPYARGGWLQTNPCVKTTKNWKNVILSYVFISGIVLGKSFNIFLNSQH